MVLSYDADAPRGYHAWNIHPLKVSTKFKVSLTVEFYPASCGRRNPPIDRRMKPTATSFYLKPLLGLLLQASSLTQCQPFRSLDMVTVHCEFANAAYFGKQSAPEMGRKVKACIPCHERKVRCDAAIVGIPCSRCAGNSRTHICVMLQALDENKA